MIHAFWVKGFDNFGANYDQIMYRSSSDGGTKWTVTENLTPQFTDAGYIIGSLNVVCDSENNLHLMFLRGSEYPKVFYMKFDGISWTASEIVFEYAISKLVVTIDSNDRIYALWYNGTMVYSFYDGANWQEPRSVSDEYLPFLSKLIVDKNNSIYASGSIGEYYYLKPFICKYDLVNEQWTDFEEIPGFEEVEAKVCALTISKDDTINVNIAVGHTDYENNNYLMKKKISDSLWRSAKFINNNMDRDKDFYRDNDDKLHLFEFSFDHSSIVYTACLKNDFTEYIFPSETETSLQIPKVHFDDMDMLYLIYRKNYHTTNERAIFFQKKQIEVGIEEPEGAGIITNSELLQNYPNPFNNATNIKYTLQQTSNVELSVYNSKGEIIEDLVNKKQEKGEHSVLFNADNINSGVYYYRLEINGVVKETKKMLYLR